MRYRRLFDGSLIPVIGLGTWRMGGGMEPDLSQDELVLQALRTALNMGYTHIDTAEMYGGGHTEELIGQVICDFERSSLFITSKVWHTNLKYADVLKACERSLRRLGTDYLDLYLIHWPEASVPLVETFRGLNELIATGKVRYIGVSNFDLDLLIEAANLSETPLVTNQVPFSLSNRSYAQNGVLDYCLQKRIILTAYTPVNRGRMEAVEQLSMVARRIGVTPAQVALSWLVSQPYIITIPKSLDSGHLRENLEAADLILGEEELAILGDLSDMSSNRGSL